MLSKSWPITETKGHYQILKGVKFNKKSGKLF